MVRIDRNNYFNNPKDYTVFTPNGISKLVADIILNDSTLKVNRVLDVCGGTGQLSKYFYKAGCRITTVDNKLFLNNYCHVYYIHNFLTTSPTALPKNYDIAVCNSPWNNPDNLRGYDTDIEEFQDYKQRLYLPEVFAYKIFTTFGFDFPLVLLTNYTFRMNQKRTSKRFRRFRDSRAKITSIATMLIDVFDAVQQQNEILFFNIPGIEPHYFIDDKYLKQDNNYENN